MALAQIDGFEEFFKEQAIKRHPENVESAFYEPGFRPEGVYEKFMAIAGYCWILLATAECNPCPLLRHLQKIHSLIP